MTLHQRIFCACPTVRNRPVPSEAGRPSSGVSKSALIQVGDILSIFVNFDLTHNKSTVMKLGTWEHCSVNVLLRHL